MGQILFRKTHLFCEIFNKQGVYELLSSLLRSFIHFCRRLIDKRALLYPIEMVWSNTKLALDTHNIERAVLREGIIEKIRAKSWISLPETVMR